MEDAAAVPAETSNARLCCGERLVNVPKNCSSNGAVRWKSFISTRPYVVEDGMRIYEHSYRKKPHRTMDYTRLSGEPKKQGEIHEEAQDCLQFLGLFM